MRTSTKLYNLIKTLKNPRLGRGSSNHQCVLWYFTDPFLQPCPNCTNHSKIRKHFFLVPQFLGFIPQSIIIRTQTANSRELCPCWKVLVKHQDLLNLFDTHRVLTTFSARKLDNSPVAIFTESMAGFYFVPRNIYTNIAQNSSDIGI